MLKVIYVNQSEHICRNSYLCFDTVRFCLSLQGNDHVMEYNHVHHNCVNASDCGAFHATRSWSFVSFHHQYYQRYVFLVPIQLHNSEFRLNAGLFYVRSVN